MPLYQIVHVCDLSDEQQDKLADAITKIHSEKFNMPKLLVNVSFQRATANTYIAGKRHKSNLLAGVLRTGPSRTKADFDDVVVQLLSAWEAIVGTEGDRRLGLVSLMGGLLSIHEQGFFVPLAGEEGAWIEENYGTFQQLAEAGDVGMKGLVQELRERECFRGFVPVVEV